MTQKLRFNGSSRTVVALFVTAVMQIASGALAQQLLWRYDTGGSIYGAPAIAEDGTLYVGSYHSVHAIYPDGSEQWTFPTGGWVSCSPAVGEDGTIYFGGGAENPPNPIPGWRGIAPGDTKLYAVNPDGTRQWAYDTGSSVDYTSPAIASDGTVYVATSRYSGQPEPSRLLALNSDGTFKWEFVTGHWNFSAPAIGRDGTVYFGTMNVEMGLVALNPDGSVKWTFPVGAWIVSSPAIDTRGEEDVIYVGTFNTGQSLIAINADGTQRWSYPIGYFVRHTAPVLDREGTIYIGATDLAVHAVNPEGTQRWRHKVGYWVEAPPAIGDDGMVYVSDMGGTLHALDTDGESQWTYKPSTYWMRGGASIKDGVLYFGSYDGNLYALSVSSTQVDDSSWPKYQADLGNTGRPLDAGGDTCQYKLKKDSKPKGGCEACPGKGDVVASEQNCEKKRDCDRKLKGKIACPDGGRGACKKIKGKRTRCG